jgi:predicted negative regulator of RcsB-dependent stress response
VSRITRKELKTDKFALEVEHTVSLFEQHRQEIIRYGGIAAVVVALIIGYSMYSRSQHTVREQALAHAIEVQEAPVGQSGSGGMSFPTQEAKDAEATKVFGDLKNKYSGSSEGQIASYYLASILADQGKMAEAEKSFQDVVQHADAGYASLAKLALAQIYFSDGRNAQGEGMLRDVMAHPTAFVSSDMAAITLAKHYAALKNTAEAKKLLEPLKSKPGVGQVAVGLLGDLQN